MKKYLPFLIGILLCLTDATLSTENARSAAASQSSFSAQQVSVNGVLVVRLIDSARGIEVSIVPSMGNKAYEMKVHGKNVLYVPEAGPSDFLKRAAQNGIPFMAPWANRMDDASFWANGRKYSFRMDVGNVRKDNNGLPIHGLLMNSAQWQVTSIGADQQSAHVTCRLEFWKYPDLMSQWPFAHQYEMTYSLVDGSLEVQTTVSNLSTEPMPLVIGFHPYYQIPDIPRDQWILHMPARKAVVADERRLPTGEFKAMELPNPLPLKGITLDDGFADLARDGNGRSKFIIEAGAKKLELLFGPKYTVAVIYRPASPPGQTWDFICIEPMTGITNAINLNHAGKYPELQTVPANGKWTESFWIRPVGF
jgi:aldose 1-epimerase